MAGMNKAIVYGNRFCHMRDVEKRNKIHKKKLKDMKSVTQMGDWFKRRGLDNSAPRQCAHLNSRAKQRQAKDERQAEIMRENVLLLDKIRKIMDTSEASDGGKNGHEFAPGVRLNRHQVPVLDTFISAVPRDKGQAMPNVIGGSLNAKQRQKQYEKTCKQNLTLFEGIKKQTSHYKVQSMNHEWEQTAKYRSNIRRNLTAGFLRKGDGGEHHAEDASRHRPQTQSGRRLPPSNNADDFMRSSGPQFFSGKGAVSPEQMRPNTSGRSASRHVLGS